MINNKLEIELNNLFTNKSIFKNVNKNFVKNLINKILNKETVVIGIIGETASGKTTISKEIFDIFNKLDIPVSFLYTDNYFKDISIIKGDKTFEELMLSGYDLDSPDAMQMDLLKSDLSKLKNGTDIYCPEYLLNGQGRSIPNNILIKSNKIIFVEGIACSYSQILYDLDIKIYIEIDENLRKERFLERSIERKLCADIIDFFWNYVCGTGKKYVQPTKSIADIVINGNYESGFFAKNIENIYKNYF